MDLVKLALVILLGAFVCAVLVIPDVILISNQNSQHNTIKEEISTIKDIITQNKIDTMIKEQLETQLKALENE
jgi:hypothetical protein